MVNQTGFLLVNDDEDDICVFKEVLEDVNPSINLASAGNGKEALQLLKQEQNKLPDNIFLYAKHPTHGW